jgi:hypothetical protein
MPTLVKLNKCIYGLRQAGFEWHLLLDTTLKKLVLFNYRQINVSILSIDPTIMSPKN